MRYWDASAIVPLLLREPTTDRARGWLREDPEIMVWWATRVECVSAIAASWRSGRLDETLVSAALDHLEATSHLWREAVPSPGVRETACRLLRVHSLRAADALQLSAALAAAEGHPSSLPFVCLDDRLRDAASKEGFPIVA